MKRFLGIALVAFLLGAGSMYAGFSYHVVRAPNELVVVRKSQPALNESYVDIRAWEVSDWISHPHIAQALANQDRHDLIKPLNPGQMLDDWLRGFRQASDGSSFPKR